MFKTILLPIDLTDRHENALATATALASTSQGEVILIHVIEVIAGLSREEERPFYDRLEQAARLHLARLGESLQRQKVRYRVEVQFGHRVAALVRYATDNQLDLIVLTAPRFDPDNIAAGWGSLSYKVSVLAPCPVLLVKAALVGKK